MTKKSKLFLSSLLLGALFLVGCSDSGGDRKAKYFQRGMELYEQGNFVKAQLEFKNVLQIDPKDVEAYYMFGQIEEKEQNWRKAYALFLRAVELNPQHAGAQVHLGRLYALSGSPDKALVAAEAALSQNPNDPAALVLKGLAQARLGKKESALKEARAAVDIDPKNMDAIALLSALYADEGDLKQAIALARTGLDNNPDRMEAHLILAQLYEKAGDTEGTIELLEKMIRLQPEDFQSRKRLAIYHATKKDNQQAEQVLREAVSALPEDADAKLTLVDFLRQNGQAKQAEIDLKAFISQSPEAYQLQLGMSKVYLESGRREEAFATYQAIIDKAGKSADGLQARARLAALLATDNKLDQAAVLVDEVLEVEPKYKEALLTRAAIALARNTSDMGIADLRTLLKEDPGYVKAIRLKARVHLAKKEFALARQTLEEAIQVRPQEMAANFELAQLLIQTGEPDDAVVVLEKILKFAPDHLGVMESIAKIRAKQQQWEAVGKMAETIEQKHPKSAVGFYYAGLAQQSEKQLGKSIENFEQALVRSPNAVEPLIALAQSLMMMKKPEQALTRVKKVIQETPEHFLAVNLMGEIYLSQKRYSDAKNAFSKAMKIKPEWSTPYKNLARVAMAEQKHEETLSILKQGFEKSGDLVIGLELATLLERMGKSEETIAQYRALLQIRPGFKAAANNLAMILVDGEPNQSSLDEAQVLVDGFEISDNPVYLDTLGWVYFKRGEWDKAIPILERADRGKMELPEIRYHLGMAYLRTGQQEKAKLKLEQALSPAAEFAWTPKVKQALAELK